MNQQTYGTVLHNTQQGSLQHYTNAAPFLNILLKIFVHKQQVIHKETPGLDSI